MSSLISLKNVSNHLWDKQILKNISWSTDLGQSWAIIGPNGSGKSTLIKIILGQLPYSGTIEKHKNISGKDKIVSVSFDQQKLFRIREGKKDRFEEFSGKEENYLTAIEVIDPNKKYYKNLQKISEPLGLSKILKKPIRHFSNGEMRKTLICKALIQNPQLIILDEPFDGLDINSSKWFSKTISELINNGLSIWLISNNFDEIVPEISHILCLKSGKIFSQGERSKILTSKKIQDLFRLKQSESFEKIELEKNKKIIINNLITPNQEKTKYNFIIKMVNVNINFKEKIVLKNFNWEVEKGENWKIIGPNGAGKSTLVSLIYGENLQIYSNKIYLFGKKRGCGESVWDIKNKIGLVSSELQLLYNEPISAEKVVLSGFHNSIGYYIHSSGKQKYTASKWLEFLEIEDLAKKNFTKLSYGQQRLILIARAMVKLPPLLIFDEPCQGLDFKNRDLVLKVIDKIAQNSTSQILYVTHLMTDQLKCMHHELRFEIKKDGTYKTVVI